MEPSFHTSIVQQADALRTLVRFYQDRMLLDRPISSLLLTGMGASLHAAQIMTFHLHALGVPALCLEATGLLHYSLPLLDSYRDVLFVSQSGASAEVLPLIERLPPDARLITVTNEPDSPLARRAEIALPLWAGDERWVATKTYVNSIALLWLLARQIAGVADGREAALLDALADACAALIAQEQMHIARWLDTLAASPPLVFVGHGPDGVTAVQTAMMLSEWAKLPAFGGSAGAFRHGFIEQVRAGSGVVCFASGPATYASIQTLAQELAGYGARVLIVNGGQTRQPDAAPEFPFDPFLAPALDVIPAQFFVEALARQLDVPPGFRYISKVVSRL